jgi:acylphosphatase
MDAVRFLVAGKVQGVWFRASAREQAVALGLQGYARNLPDGRVEVVVAGEPSALGALEDWLQRGPPLARVTELQREALASAPEFDGFAIR